MALFNPVSFSDLYADGQAPTFAPPPVIAGGMATGRGNALVSGLQSGFYGAGQQIANTGEAVARTLGAGGLGDTLAGMAARAGAAERGSANQQYEESPWSPGGLVYQIAQGIPALVGGGAAALGGEVAGPALGISRLAGGLIGAGASQFPLMAGGNVQAAKDANEGQLSQGNAAKALALGVPEAALGAYLPAKLEGALAHGITGPLAARAFKGALTSAAIQAPVAAAQTALTQLNGDPNATIADRAHEIVQSALKGAFQGGVFGGAVHALSRAPINETSTDNIAAAVDQDLKPPAPPPEPVQTGGTQVALRGSTEPTPYVAPEPASGVIEGQVKPLPAPPDIRTAPAPAEEPVASPEPVIQVPPTDQFANTDDAALLRQVTNFQPDDPQRQAALAEIARRVQEKEPQRAVGEAGSDAPSETTVPSPQELESARADVKKWVSGKRIPDELDPVQQVALHQELLEREDNGRSFKRLEPLAQKLGLINEDGSVVRPKPEDQPPAGGERPLGASEPDQPVGNAPPRDTIPEAARPAFDTLDDMSKQLAKSTFTPEDRKTITDRVDAAKSALLDGKKQSIVKADQLVKEITGKKTIEPVVEKAAVEPVAEPAPAPKAAGTKAKPLADLTKIKTSVQDALDQHMKLETSLKLPDNATAAAKADFAAHMTQQRKTLEAIKKAADAGDNTRLEKLSRTIDTSQDGFRSGKIFDVAANYVKPNTLRENALFDHGDAEENVKSALHDAFPTETPRIGASGTITPHDQALEELVNTSNSGRDTLDFLRQHGSNGYVKAYATLLHRNGVDPKMQFASAEGRKFDNDRVSSGNAQSSYNVGSNRINLYDRSNMEQNVLHEMTHAATMKALASGSETAKEAQRLFDVLKSRSPDSEAYGLTNAKEMVAEAMNNPTFRDFLKGESVSTGSRVGDMWQAVKNMVFKALRMPTSMRTMFDQVMENAHNLINENASAAPVTGDVETASIKPGTPQAANAAAKSAVTQETNLAENAAKILKAEAGGFIRNLVPKIRAGLLGWTNSDRIADMYGHLVQSMPKFIAERGKLSARNESFAQFARVALRSTEALKPEDQTRLSNAMALTQLAIDPRKSWAEHTWLHAAKDAAELAKVVGDANKEWNELKRVGGDKAYEALHAANDAHAYAGNALAMHEVVNSGFLKQLGGVFAQDHFDKFQYDSVSRNDPVKANAYWKGVSDQMVAELKAHIATENSEAAKLPTVGEQRSRIGQTSVLRSVLGSVEATNERLNQAPNFHLGREGDYMVSGHIAPTADGTPNNAAIEKIQKSLAARGFHEIMVQRNAENGSLYMRVENADQMGRLRAAMTALQEEGVLDKTKEIASGLAANVNVQRDVSPAWMHKMIAAAREAIPELPEGADPKMKAEYKTAVDELKDQMARTWLDMLPDNSVRKIYQPRMNVQGANSDMIANFKRRAGISGRALANNSTQRAVSDALVGMKNDVRGLVENNKVSNNNKIAAGQAVNELLLRDAQRKWTVPTPGMDRMRAIAHTFEVGSSPAYFMTLMSQLGTLSLPELGKTHGFAKSFGSLANNTSMAFKVMRGAMQGGDGAHFGLNEDGLRKAGVPEKTIDFIMHHSNRGDFNLASYTQAMVGHDHGVFGKYTAPLNALGLYSEMLPRVLTALAAKDLYDNHGASNPARYTKMGSEGFHQFVSDKVRGSQFTWDATNNPRATTKGGPFGPASPLINQFMGFKLKMIEKLHSEIADAFNKSGPEKALEARRFLVAHLAATTVLAGTLAVPFFGAFAGAYDRVANALTGEDNNDIQAQYRTYLANTFGKDIGEIAARGLPRALGFDLSHLGDQNLLPGTQLLQDKRKLQDQEADWLKSMAGSSVGMVMNDILGARDIANGDWMNGAIKIVPEVLRNPLEAARLAQHGFADKTGDKLPITATAKDILLKAIGLDPAKEAEYDEAKRVEAGAAALRSARSQNITEHLVLAEQRGDQEKLSYWLGQSQKYGADHPGLRQPAATLQRSLMQHMQAAAFAKNMGTPIGVKPTDLVGRRETSFANFGE